MASFDTVPATPEAIAEAERQVDVLKRNNRLGVYEAFVTDRMIPPKQQAMLHATAPSCAIIEFRMKT